MRKISTMYQWSGGTDYRHTCKECRNCVRVQRGKRAAYKCLSYGDTASAASDWLASYIACKAFDLDPPPVPVMQLGTGWKHGETQAVGQMSLFEFMEDSNE